MQKTIPFTAHDSPFFLFHDSFSIVLASAINQRSYSPSFFMQATFPCPLFYSFAAPKLINPCPII